MLLNQMKKHKKEQDIATVFTEKTTEQDERLALYKKILNDISPSSATDIRLFTEIQISGLTQSELETAHYQLFSTIGLDRVINPLVLLEGQTRLCVSREEWRENITYMNQLSFLRIQYPYRNFEIFKVEIISLNEYLSPEQIAKFGEMVKKYELGYTLPFRSVFLEQQETLFKPFDVSEIKREIELLCSAPIEQIISQPKLPSDSLPVKSENTHYALLLLERPYHSQISHSYSKVMLMNQLEEQDDRDGKQTYFFDLKKQSILQVLLSLPFAINLKLQIFPYDLVEKFQNKILIKHLNSCFIIILPQDKVTGFFNTLKSSDLNMRVVGHSHSGDSHYIEIGTDTLILPFHADSKDDLSEKIEQKNYSLKTENEEFIKTILYTLNQQKSVEPIKVGLLSYFANSMTKAIKKSGQLRNIILEPLSFNLSGHHKFSDSLTSIVKKMIHLNLIVIPDCSIPTEQLIPPHKILAAVLEDEKIKEAIQVYLQKKGKIIGYGAGNRALVECGLLPYGRFREWGDAQVYCYQYKDLNRNVEMLGIPDCLWQYYLDQQLIIKTESLSNTANIIMHQSSNQLILGISSEIQYVSDEDKYTELKRFLIKDLCK